MRCLPALLGAAVVAVLGGCGGGSGDHASGSGASSSAEAPVTPPQRLAPTLPPALQLPRGVPDQGSGSADAASAGVIRAWASALIAGRIGRASDRFGAGARVQNGTPVLRLDSGAERVAFNRSLPCGAQPTKLQAGSGGYTIVTFRLVERRGGDCMGAAGNSARSAIRVRNGHITDWYRLAGQPGQSRPQPPSSAIDPGTAA